jgi:glucose-1-phosphate thymidylyltransferase
MKALILAGGTGSRLRPLTYTSAKQLVPVANKPVLFYGIEAVVEAGIRDVGIVVGDTRAEIEAAVGDGSALGARVSYIEQEAPLGLAHAVLIAEEFLGEEPFVMYLGDNLIAGGIAGLVEEFRREGPAAEILLAKVPNPEQFGVAELDEAGRVVSLEEKPAEPKSNFALVGVYMFTASVFESVRRIAPSQRGELEITDAIQDLIDRDQEVLSHQVRGWWKDTGMPEDILEANRIVLEKIDASRQSAIEDDSRIEGRVVLGADTRISNSLVRGPAIIGDGVHLEEAFIGPYTSIGDGCRLVRCEVENSIVMQGTRIEDLPRRMDGSLIGRDVRIARSEGKPAAYRFVLGDGSQIGIT